MRRWTAPPARSGPDWTACGQIERRLLCTAYVPIQHLRICNSDASTASHERLRTRYPDLHTTHRRLRRHHRPAPRHHLGARDRTGHSGHRDGGATHPDTNRAADQADGETAAAAAAAVAATAG